MTGLSLNGIQQEVNIFTKLPPLERIEEIIVDVRENQGENFAKFVLMPYLSSVGMLGWWWNHEIHDHFAKKNDKPEYARRIAEFAGLEAYSTMSPNIENAITAGNHLRAAALAHDECEDKGKDIWETVVAPNLVNFFVVSGKSKECGEYRSIWWLKHHAKDFREAQAAFSKELELVFELPTELSENYGTMMMYAVKEHDSKRIGWIFRAFSNIEDVYRSCFASSRSNYKLPPRV